LALRKMPNCPNMFSANEVQRLAFDNEFYELVNLITDNKRLYSHFILTGETEERNA